MCMVCFSQTKEEQVGTLEAVQAVQVQSGHLQKSREGYHSKCIELDRLRKEGAPQKELEKVCPLGVILYNYSRAVLTVMTTGCLLFINEWLLEVY